MTMLDLLDALEKYRRLDRAAGPVVYLTPLAQQEAPVAVGGQFDQTYSLHLRCEVPWTRSTQADGDLLLRLVERVLDILEAHREVGQARRGRVGKVVYRYEQRRDGSSAFVALIPVEFTADQ